MVERAGASGWPGRRAGQVAPLLSRSGGRFADLIADAPAPALIAALRAQLSSEPSAARIHEPLGGRWLSHLRRLRPVLDWSNLGTRMEVLMRSKLLKVALGCGFAAALVAPAVACEFNKTSAQNDQPMAQSQQTTPDAPQTAQSQPADTGSN